MQAIANVASVMTGGKTTMSGRSRAVSVMTTPYAQLKSILLFAPPGYCPVVETIDNCLHWRHIGYFAFTSRGDKFAFEISGD
jgi:hypothetical protein